MPNKIHSYTELRKQIREALRRQHPEWVDANGKSPLCDSYDARLAKLLALFTLRRTIGREVAWDLFQTFLRPNSARTCDIRATRPPSEKQESNAMR